MSVRQATGRAVHTWRRSLQLRVVTTTLLLSALVVGLLGFLLLQQVGNGLLDNKVTNARVEANNGLVDAQKQFGQLDAGDDPKAAQTIDEIAQSLSNRGSRAGLYTVVLLGDSINVGFGPPQVDRSDIPQRLRDAIVVQRVQQAWIFAPLTSGGTTTTGLIVGSPLRDASGQLFELYYLFPLDPERQTLALVQQRVLVAGAVLVLLLAGIALLVTRQVVLPVRLAARIAERLSAGRLAERMRVRGEDDLARLATSFNGMAGSLQAQIGELEDLSRVQRRFVADVSHELRTPLTTVRLAADLLHDAREDFTAAAARSAELLHTELGRFERLLEDLLEISRFDARAAELEVEPVDIREVVRSVAEMARGVAERRGATIDLSEMPAGPVVAEVDRRRVQRVLRNLVVNAVEYGEGSLVQIRVAGDEHAVAVAVRDHGRGLQPEEVTRLFDRFWRADPSRARQTGGTGLGLSIALEDTRLHGGWLQPWGRPGEGAQFRLTLPRKVGGALHSSPLPLEPVGPPVAAVPQPTGVRW